MDQKHSERILLRVATVLIGISVILVALAFTRLSGLPSRVLTVTIAALIFLLGGFLIYLVILSRRAQKGDHNYFLYDRALKKNMSPEQLTSAHVSLRTMHYMSLFRRGKQLYISSLFDENGGAPEVFKPLFCYQLLEMMSVCTEKAQWQAFLDGGKELADVFSTYLLMAGEDELCRDVQYYMASAKEDVEPFRSYLESKSEYLSQRMLEYTKQHLHEFD